MNNINPSQTRQIDPYSSYESNVVNRLTRMVSRNTNCIHSPKSLDVIEDSTSSNDHVIVTTGQLFKDDVLITIDNNFSVDMSDSNFYISGTAFNEAGYYWILGDYTYQKSKPAPKLSIKILKPSQHSLFTSAYIFLKAVKVVFNGSTFEISSFHDEDPIDSTNGKRIYSQLYTGKESSLPTYNNSRDEGRLVYVEDKASLYFGTNNSLEIVDSVRDIIDTTSCTSGDIIYIGNDGKAYPANASLTSTSGTAVCLTSGLESDGSGKVKIVGRVDNVPVETGVSISIGDKIYLSSVEDGTISNVKSGKEIFLGFSLSNSSSKISMWLQPSMSINGSSGYSGISGFSGYSGISGLSGISGISGFSGSAIFISSLQSGSGWNIIHNKSRQGIVVNVWDTDWNKIIPYNVKSCTGGTSCYITFLSNVSGYATVL